MGDEKLNRQEKRDDLIRRIQVLMEQNSGIVKTSQLYTLGMDYRKIQSFVEDGVLEKVKNGYYAVNFYKKREEDLVAALFSDGVLTMESALSPSNGSLPVSISYMTTPREYRSVR